MATSASVMPARWKSREWCDGTPEPHTPSVRAQRSNPESLRGGTLDCFAALAMTAYAARACSSMRSLLADAPARSRGCFGPSFAVRFALERPKGAGKAGRRLAPADPRASKTHTGWITGVAGHPALPARMVLTVSFVLSPGSDALLPPSPRRLFDARIRSDTTHHRET